MGRREKKAAEQRVGRFDGSTLYDRMFDRVAHGIVEPPEPEWPLPSDWIQDNFFLYDTGELITLLDCQIRPVNLAFTRGEDGLLVYRTIIWSWPKKSAKSSVIAAVCDYVATHKSRASVKLIANDLRQANSRVGMYLRENIKHVHKHGSREDPPEIISTNRIEYPNGSVIEMIPVDPAGEAGGNDDIIVYSELWAWKSQLHQDMWAEMTLSPNKPDSQRWVDTYAGYSGESPILEPLYQNGVKNGKKVWDDLEVYENKVAQQLTVWVTVPMMPWQTQRYYNEQAASLTDVQMARMHKNQWTSSTTTFVYPQWWEKCRHTGPAMSFERESLIVTLDAAVVDDCFAIVAGHMVDEIVYPRFTRIWKAEKGEPILYSNALDPEDLDTPEGYIRWLNANYDLAYGAYDAYQLHDFATRLEQSLNVVFEPFSQGKDRAVADKMLYDSIKDRRVIHFGDEALTEHVTNANRKEDEKQLRIVKRAQHLKIDACVCLSMLNYVCREELIL